MVAVMLLAVQGTAQSIGLGSIAALVGSLIVFGGKVLFGIIIFLAGIYLANIASNVITSTGGSDAIFLALVETLDEADVPDSPRFLIGDPSMKVDILKVDKFVSSDYTRQVVPTGKIGVIYNADVYITNNLVDAGTGNYGVYAHRDAIGVVIQKNPRVRVWDMGYKFITKIIVDAAWGADEIRDTFGKCFYTRYN